MDVSIDGDGHNVEQGTHTCDVTDSRDECAESRLGGGGGRGGRRGRGGGEPTWK